MNAERLLELADHLDRGKLLHSQFDFTTISDSVCRTAGCALGECPAVWAMDWAFRLCEDGAFIVTTGEGKDSKQSAVEFFAIDPWQYEFLFLPDMFPAPWNEMALEDDATRYDVARGIRNFVEYAQEREEIKQLLDVVEVMA